MGSFLGTRMAGAFCVCARAHMNLQMYMYQYHILHLVKCIDAQVRAQITCHVITVIQHVQIGSK